MSLADPAAVAAASSRRRGDLPEPGAARGPDVRHRGGDGFHRAALAAAAPAILRNSLRSMASSLGMKLAIPFRKTGIAVLRAEIAVHLPINRMGGSRSDSPAPCRQAVHRFICESHSPFRLDDLAEALRGAGLPIHRRSEGRLVDLLHLSALVLSADDREFVPRGLFFHAGPFPGGPDRGGAPRRDPHPRASFPAVRLPRGAPLALHAQRPGRPADGQPPGPPPHPRAAALLHPLRPEEPAHDPGARLREQPGGPADGRPRRGGGAGHRLRHGRGLRAAGLRAGGRAAVHRGGLGPGLAPLRAAAGRRLEAGLRPPAGLDQPAGGGLRAGFRRPRLPGRHGRGHRLRLLLRRPGDLRAAPAPPGPVPGKVRKGGAGHGRHGHLPVASGGEPGRGDRLPGSGRRPRAGDDDCLEAILDDLGLSLSIGEIEAYMRDELFQGDRDLRRAVERCLQGRPIRFYSRTQEKAFHRFLREMWDELQRSYDPVRRPGARGGCASGRCRSTTIT